MAAAVGSSLVGSGRVQKVFGDSAEFFWGRPNGVAKGERNRAWEGCPVDLLCSSHATFTQSVRRSVNVSARRHTQASINSN